MKTVYLAGPITGLGYAAATRWREQAKLALAPNIACYSPLRGKEHLYAETVIRGDYPGHALTSAAGITARDRLDCTTCDLLLVNLLGATQVSVGTCIELGWADAHRTPIVLVMEPDGNPHEHPIVSALAPFRAATLDEALALIRAILLP